MDVGSLRFENVLGSIEEGIGDWGSVMESRWDCEAESDSQSSRLNSEKRELNAQLILCAKNLGCCQAYVERRPDLSPTRTYVRILAQNEAYWYFIQKLVSPFVPQ